MTWWQITLDVVRTAAAVAVPVVVAIAGYWLSRRLQALETRQWLNQELIKVQAGLLPVPGATTERPNVLLHLHRWLEDAHAARRHQSQAGLRSGVLFCPPAVQFQMR